MTRDPLLPVRLVDGVWISAEPTFASPIADDPFTPTPPSTGCNFRCFPDPSVFADVVLPPRPATDYARAFAEYNPPPLVVTVDADEARKVAEHVLAHGQRTIFAAVALDGSGVWAIGDTAEEARTFAEERRGVARDDARALDIDFPDASTDAAWLDGFALVTLSGTTSSLRALVKSMETGDDVIPWCPFDLWDNPEPTKETP